MPSIDDTLQDQFVHELGAVRKNIEQTANLYSRLYEKQSPFNPEILKAFDEELITSEEQALRFGSYGACFVYTAAYGQPQHAADYLKEVLRLSQMLGIESAFDEEQLKLLYSTNPEIDKSKELTKAFLKATEQLYSDERALHVAYMVLGGWIEGMGISYEECSEYIHDENIRLALYDQTYSYYNTQRVLKVFAENPEVLPFIAIIDSLEPVIAEVVRTRGEIDSALYEQVRIQVQIARSKLQ